MNWEELFAKTGVNSAEELKNILLENGFEKSFKIFNVVGTNGKGSVSNFLAQGFMCQDKKVGLFTSPHILVPNERIQINGKAITDGEFKKIYDKFKHLKLNFFAFTYIVAMIYFHEQECEVVVLEAGIGGDKDSTKAIPGDWGCVTSISLDHIEILGNTLEEIAEDKSGVINDDMRFFIPSTLKENLQAPFLAKAFKKTIIPNNASGYKKQNSKFAAGILKFLDIKFDDFKLPLGRTETFSHNGFNITVDVAHNIDGIVASLKQLEIDEVNYDQVVITLNRSKDSTGVKQLFKDKGFFVFEKSKSFYSAAELEGANIEKISKFFKDIDKDTLFIGSFHLAHEVFNVKDK